MQEHEDKGHSLPGRWVNSHELRAGDCIITRTGTRVLITEIRQRFDDAFPVSNLSIIDHHNYAVGDVGVLVHNKPICDEAIAALRKDRDAGRSIDDIQALLNQLVKDGKHTQKEVDDALAKLLDRDWPNPPDITSGSSGGQGAGKKIPQSLRDKFFPENQEHPLCAYCRQERATDLDHVQPRSKGGDLTPENITPACKHCNTSKGARETPKTPPKN